MNAIKHNYFFIECYVNNHQLMLLKTYISNLKNALIHFQLRSFAFSFRKGLQNG